jgi:4-hydroxybenzoyl-CoA reductase subunit beta
LVTGYQKLRIRASIDYPALTVAVAAELDAAGNAQQIRMVLSALGSRPHPIKRIEHLQGRPLDAKAIEELGQAAFKQCHPLTNINVDPGWRRQMIPVFVRRAWAQALAVKS